MTNFSSTLGTQLVHDWNALLGRLLWTFREGSVSSAAPPAKHPRDYPRPSVKETGYPDAWKTRIVEETGDRYLIPDSELETEHSRRKAGIA